MCWCDVHCCLRDTAWSEAGQTGALFWICNHYSSGHKVRAQQRYLKGLESPTHSVDVYSMATPKVKTNTHNKVWLCFSGGVVQKEILK